MGQRALAKIETWDFEEDVRGLRRAIAQVTRKITAESRHGFIAGSGANPA
jgi:hypothetical protein